MRIPELISLGLIATSAIVTPASALDTKYPTVEEAQRILCAGQSLTPLKLTLDKTLAKQIEKASGDKVRHNELHVWKTSKGGAFFVDRVRGKHEWITYAVALDSSGRVTGMEILEYLETYGYQVGNKKWQAQFHGKNATGAQLEFDEDIKNISGATISCRNITRGVRRLSTTFAMAVKPAM